MRTTVPYVLRQMLPRPKYGTVICINVLAVTCLVIQVNVLCGIYSKKAAAIISISTAKRSFKSDGFVTRNRSFVFNGPFTTGLQIYDETGRPCPEPYPKPGMLILPYYFTN